MNKKSFWWSIVMSISIVFVISPIPIIIENVLNVSFISEIILTIFVFALLAITDYLKKQKIKMNKILIFLGFMIAILIAIITGYIDFGTPI